MLGWTYGILSAEFAGWLPLPFILWQVECPLEMGVSFFGEPSFRITLMDPILREAQVGSHRPSRTAKSGGERPGHGPAVAANEANISCLGKRKRPQPGLSDDREALCNLRCVCGCGCFCGANKLSCFEAKSKGNHSFRRSLFWQTHTSTNTRPQKPTVL